MVISASQYFYIFDKARPYVSTQLNEGPQFYHIWSSLAFLSTSQYFCNINITVSEFPRRIFDNQIRMELEVSEPEMTQFWKDEFIKNKIVHYSEAQATEIANKMIK